MRCIATFRGKCHFLAYEKHVSMCMRDISGGAFPAENSCSHRVHRHPLRHVAAISSPIRSRFVHVGAARSVDRSFLKSVSFRYIRSVVDVVCMTCEWPRVIACCSNTSGALRPSAESMFSMAVFAVAGGRHFRPSPHEARRPDTCASLLSVLGEERLPGGMKKFPSCMRRVPIHRIRDVHSSMGLPCSRVPRRVTRFMRWRFASRRVTFRYM